MQLLPGPTHQLLPPSVHVSSQSPSLDVGSAVMVSNQSLKVAQILSVHSRAPTAAIITKLVIQ